VHESPVNDIDGGLSGMCRRPHSTKRLNVIRKAFAIFAATTLAAIPALPAFAEDAGGSKSDIEFVFVDTDTNGNGVIDTSEILEDVISDFQDADTNQDGVLDKTDAGEDADSAEFADGDTNKDGKISVEEAVAEKLLDFKAADKDGNGSLTIEEVTAAVEK
jgi:Ca2+-binding EF-hand superfamily protein